MADVTAMLAHKSINIATMQLYRAARMAYGSDSCGDQNSGRRACVAAPSGGYYRKVTLKSSIGKGSYKKKE